MQRGGRGAERDATVRRAPCAVRREAVHPIWQHRQHRDPQRFGSFDRRTLGKDVVGLEREVRMLLGRADGEHDPVVAPQGGLELNPVEVADSHRAANASAKPNPRLGERRDLENANRIGRSPRRGRKLPSLAVRCRAAGFVDLAVELFELRL